MKELLYTEVCPQVKVLSYNTGLLVVFAVIALLCVIGWAIDGYQKHRERRRARDLIRRNARRMQGDSDLARRALAACAANVTGQPQSRDDIQ
jgi:type III secretory pathway component EscU